MDNQDSQNEIELESTLLNIYFRAKDSAYIVGIFESESLEEPFTATGEIISPSISDSYSLTGSWATHPKYGRQFKFTSYSIIYPATREGIEKYLSSGLIKGIGKTYARRIVKKFGEQTIDILNHDIHRLLEVDGVGEKKLEKIKTSWEEQRGVQNVMLFLKSHNVSTAYAIRIYKTYSQKSIQIIQENPYKLIDDVDGIGFIIADRIAQQLGIEQNDERRLIAGLHYVLLEASRNNGHVYLPYDEIVQSASAILSADENSMRNAITLAIEHSILILEEDRIFIPEAYYAEINISQSLQRLYHAEHPSTDPRKVIQCVQSIEQKRNIAFSSLQIDAIQRSISEPVTIITGGPGTGKSTTVLGILAVADQLQWSVAMCAPTGRAAKRLTEVTGHEAKTIHRLLEFDPFIGVFQRNESNPIEADLVIVDEVSMVDSMLMAYLLRAIRDESRVVFVGDKDQLPSVGPGNVLHDMIESKQIPLVILKTIFRQAQESAIITNSHRVREGVQPAFKKDCFFVDVENTEDIPLQIEDIVINRLPNEMSYHPMHDIQVLSPMHNTASGVRNMNIVLQQVLNARGNIFYRKGDRVFRVGDKVMQTKNNYDKDVFNGDIGFINSVDLEESTCTIMFDTRKVIYSFDDLDDVTLAYCITIHKSQGSEYKVVIIPMTMQHRIMLQRNLIYTGMTRAKELLIFVGQRSALNVAIHNNRIARRYTALKEKIVGMLK